MTAHTNPLLSKPHLLASTSNDRYVRLHSTADPPAAAGDRQDTKGEVLAKVYVGAVPTAIMWDGQDVMWDLPGEDSAEVEEDGDEEEVWGGMENVEEDDSDDEAEAPKRAGKKSRK